MVSLQRAVTGQSTGPPESKLVYFCFQGFDNIEDDSSEGGKETKPGCQNYGMLYVFTFSKLIPLSFEKL